MWIFFLFFFWGGGALRNRTFFLGGGGGGGVSFLYIIGRFKVKIQNWNIFGANFQIFLGIPDIPLFLLIFFIDFFWGVGGWGKTVDAGSKPMYEEKLRVPPGVSLGTYLYF